MNPEQPTRKTDTFKVTATVALALIAMAVAWLAYRVENLPAQPSSQPSAQTETRMTEKTPTNQSTTVTSGKGGFTVTLPDGWGPGTKATAADLLIMSGTAQPSPGENSGVKVTEVANYGSDNPFVFSIVMLDKGGFAAPQGEATDFSVGKAEDELKGKKYVHTYLKDSETGVGKLRLAGDRDYEYVFTVGAKELRVFYSVYGSDPRNHIETVDDIVRSITVKK